MPNRYVALRRLKVGEGFIEPGQEVPVDHSWKTVRELVDGGYMAAIPDPNDFADVINTPSNDHLRPVPPATQEASGTSGGGETPSTASEDASGENTGESGDSEIVDQGYDPSEHTVEDVLDYCADNEDQIPFIIDRERSGRNRKTLIAALEGE
jgi:hypothetical protein